MTERLSFDPPKLLQDEATELCVYHLRMASSLFQLVPDDNNEALIAEINRQCGDEVLDIDSIPAKAWAGLMLTAYEAMKDND